MSNSISRSSVWVAAGVDSTVSASGDVPGVCEHRKVAVRGLSGLWDPGVVQLVAVLRHKGVGVVEACQNGWGAGVSFLVLGSVADVDQAARLLGHVVPVGVAARLVGLGGAGVDWKGPWVDLGAGWALGVVVREGVVLPALVWPSRLTAGLTQRLWREFNLMPAPERRVGVFRSLFSAKK